MFEFPLFPGKIEIKDYLSLTEAEIGAELGTNLKNPRTSSHENDEKGSLERKMLGFRVFGTQDFRALLVEVLTI